MADNYNAAAPSVVLTDQSQRGAWLDFDVAPDGRFVAVVRESLGAQQPLTVVTDWRVRAAAAR